MAGGGGVVVEWLTISELAGKTDIAESTIRRYLNNFDNFFNDTGGKRSKRFEETAVKVLIRIRELYEKGYESEEVRRVLSQEFSLIIDGESSENKQGNKVKNNELTEFAVADEVVAIRELLEEQRNFNKTLLELLHQQEIRIQQMMEIQHSQTTATMEAIKEPEAVESEVPNKKSFFQRLFK